MPQSKWERGFWASVRGNGNQKFNPYPPEHWRKPKTNRKRKEKKKENGFKKVILKPNSNKACKIFYNNGSYLVFYGQNLDHEFQLLRKAGEFKTLNGAIKASYQYLEMKMPEKRKIAPAAPQLTFFD